MAYLGRRGALAPLTSADIPVGIVEGTDIAFLENSSGQTLAGTYSTERMYLSGRTGSAPNDYNYKLEGDVTVTGHLALGSIADEDIVITQDSTERTITGSGTLEAGELLSSKETDLTGMTGELGSVVTGSPNLNLGNAIYPVGHILQTKSYFTSSNSLTVVCAANTFVTLGTFQIAITPSSTSSKILVMLHIGSYNFSSTNYGVAGAGVFKRKIASGSFTDIGGGSGNTNFNAGWQFAQNTNTYYNGIDSHFLDSPNTESECTYGIGVADHNNSGKTFYLNRKENIGDSPSTAYFGSSITVMEIKG